VKPVEIRPLSQRSGWDEIKRREVDLVSSFAKRGFLTDTTRPYDNLGITISDELRHCIVCRNVVIYWLPVTGHRLTRFGCSYLPRRLKIRFLLPCQCCQNFLFPFFSSHFATSQFTVPVNHDLLGGTPSKDLIDKNALLCVIFWPRRIQVDFKYRSPARWDIKPEECQRQFMVW
jgi:hypothetical protein